MEKAYNSQAVKVLRALGENWDGYGARPIGKGALAAVRSANVAPTTEGGVRFEWEGNGWDTEIEFGRDGDLVGFRHERT